LTEPTDRHDAARRRHLIALWERLLREPSVPQVDRWLAGELRAERKFGRRDREWITERCFAAWRFGYFALVARELSQPPRAPHAVPTNGSRVAPWLGLESPDVVLEAWRTIPKDEFFDWIEARRAAAGSGAAPPKSRNLLEVRDALERLASAGRLAWAGIPHWYAPALERRTERSRWETADVQRFLALHERRPPLWLRLNRLDREGRVVTALRENGFEVEARGRALRVEGRRSLFEIDVYRDGAIEIQDLASQAIGEAVPVQPGQMVWDACAGGGGKTLQLATTPELAGGGAVYASDVRAYKLEEVKRRARRAGLSNVRTIAWDGEVLPSFGREVEKRGGFHSVLVDAPCSASGTWRRNPDAMFRFDLRSLPDLTTLQGSLLRSSARAVRPGGHLVYATCSWLIEENEEVVAAFLAEASAFALRAQHTSGNPREDSDATFVAVMQRAE
jgi:16S rRNA (cytosine967-C5)-methyltransferase